MKSIKDINFEGLRVLTRVDFNVPLNDQGEITDDSRMQAHLKTIKAILAQGGRPVLMSHLGRPKGERKSELSLTQLVGHLERLTGAKVLFSANCIGEEAIKLSNSLKANEILLLENLRYHIEETQGDREFAKSLAKLGDFYVNDAFGTAHRAHASTAIIAEFFPANKAFGLVMEAEILNVDKVVNSNEKPVVAIVGGAKVSSKIGILENLLSKVDHLIIGGGMAFTFIKAKGGLIGNSLVEEDYLEMAASVEQKAQELGVTLHLPQDVLAGDDFRNEAKQKVFQANAIQDGWMGLDAGDETLAHLKSVVSEAKVILWNGPLGVFEFDNFAKGTREMAHFIAEATQKGAFSLVGGGDSVAAIKKFGLADQVSYVSTGGGAMLEYLEGKLLPGIKAIQS